MASEVHAQRLLVFLLFLAVALVAALALPFWAPLTLAAVFAAALQSWMDGLARLLRGRRRLAAAILTFAFVLAVLLPLGGLGAGLVRETLAGVKWLREALASDGVWGLVRRLPDPAEQLVRRLVEAIPEPDQLLQNLAGAGGDAAQAVGGFLLATGSALLKTFLFLVALFFLLSDGAAMVAWLDAHVPLRPGQLRTLLSEFRRTSVSVVLSTVGTAAIQTAIALVGFLHRPRPQPALPGLRHPGGGAHPGHGRHAGGGRWWGSCCSPPATRWPGRSCWPGRCWCRSPTTSPAPTCSAADCPSTAACSSSRCSAAWRSSAAWGWWSDRWPSPSCSPPCGMYRREFQKG